MMSAARVLVRLQRSGKDHVPRLACFTESVVDYFDGKNEIADVCAYLDDNSLIISDEIGGNREKLVLKRPSFCPVTNLTKETEIPEDTLARGISTGVAIILESSDGKVLLTKRAPHLRAFPNVWVPPGGHIEVNESLTTAGLRELCEETGLDITEKDCEGNQLVPLALWESVYPPRLSLGTPIRHHIVLYLHAKLTKSLSSDHLFEKLKFDPGEVSACTWLDRNIMGEIVKQNEECPGDVVINHSLPSTVKASVLSEGNLQVTAEISIKPLLQKSSQNEDCERVSTGTKYAIEQLLLKSF